MLYHIDDLGSTRKLIRKNRKIESAKFRFFTTSCDPRSNRTFYMIAIPTSKFNGVLNTYQSVENLVAETDGDLVAECEVRIHDEESKRFIYSDVKQIIGNDDATYKELSKVYVYPEYRGCKLGKYFVKTISEYAAFKDILMTEAGALKKEYPEDPGDDKCAEIASQIAAFYEKCGYVSVNDFSKFETKEALVYVNQASAIPLINFYKRNHMDPMFSN